jgi:predicted nucleic acid-binding protein
MARHLLDTNIVSYLVDTASPFHARARDRLGGLAADDEVAISILSLYELHHWFAFDAASRSVADEIIRDFVLLPLPAAGAERFGVLMRDLRSNISRGEMERRAVDCMIAVTAIEHDAVLVSNDGLFRTLASLEPRLMIENWAE